MWWKATSGSVKTATTQPSSILKKVEVKKRGDYKQEEEDEEEEQILEEEKRKGRGQEEEQKLEEEKKRKRPSPRGSCRRVENDLETPEH